MCFGPDGTVFAALVAALLFVVIRVVMVGKLPASIPGRGRLDVRASWLTNVTILSSVLAGAFKDLVADATYIVVSLVFATMAIVALLVVLAAARQTVTDYYTPTWAYLVSATLALWAGAGQILMLFCIIKHANWGPDIQYTAWVFYILVSLAAIMLAVYVAATMRAHLTAAIPPDTPALEARPPVAEWSFL